MLKYWTQKAEIRSVFINKSGRVKRGKYLHPYTYAMHICKYTYAFRCLKSQMTQFYHIMNTVLKFKFYR